MIVKLPSQSANIIYLTNIQKKEERKDFAQIFLVFSIVEHIKNENTRFEKSSLLCCILGCTAGHRSSSILDFVALSYTPYNLKRSTNVTLSSGRLYRNQITDYCHVVPVQSKNNLLFQL